MRISNSWLFKEAGSVFYAKKMKGLSNQLATLISLHQSIKLATSSKTPLDFQQKIRNFPKRKTSLKRFHVDTFCLRKRRHFAPTLLCAEWLPYNNNGNKCDLSLLQQPLAWKPLEDIKNSFKFLSDPDRQLENSKIFASKCYRYATTNGVGLHI